MLPGTVASVDDEDSRQTLLLITPLHFTVLTTGLKIRIRINFWFEIRLKSTNYRVFLKRAFFLKQIRLTDHFLNVQRTHKELAYKLSFNVSQILYNVLCTMCALLNVPI